MKIKLSLFLTVVIFLSACGGKPGAVVPISTEPPAPIPLSSSSDQPLPTVTPVCISSQPVQADIDRALAYTGDLFGAPEWVRSYAVADGRVSVSWSNDPLSAVAYVEALIFPCSYEEPDLDNFFNNDNWKIIFGNYTSFEAVSACKTNDGVRLYQFKAMLDTAEYAIKYWAKNDTDTRVLTAMIVFPVGSKSQMDQYSMSLFPNFTSCP